MIATASRIGVADEGTRLHRYDHDPGIVLLSPAT
jgi:hypothetical protein